MLFLRFRYWFADVWAKWWWLYIILGMTAPLWLPWIGVPMRPGEHDDCVSYSHVATTC